jgi:hypothetical protein
MRRQVTPIQQALVNLKKYTKDDIDSGKFVGELLAEQVKCWMDDEGRLCSQMPIIIRHNQYIDLTPHQEQANLSQPIESQTAMHGMYQTTHLHLTDNATIEHEALHPGSAPKSALIRIYADNIDMHIHITRPELRKLRDACDSLLSQLENLDD